MKITLGTKSVTNKLGILMKKIQIGTNKVKTVLQPPSRVGSGLLERAKCAISFPQPPPTDSPHSVHTTLSKRMTFSSDYDSTWSLFQWTAKENKC